MSIELMDEHEQGERVRAWLRENGASIVTGVALGIAGIVGWQWWGAAQQSHRMDAAAQYLALTKSVERQDRDGSEAIVTSLVTDYKDTPYSLFGAFIWADQQVQAGEIQGAVATLRDAVSRAKDPSLKSIAETRLARALIAAGDADAALGLLAAGTTPSQHELRGDALLLLGRRDEAIADYQRAFDAYDANLPTKRLVEMKLLNLGVRSADADA